MEVPRDQIHLYGCAAVEPTDATPTSSRVTDLVEKPDAEEAPSNFAVIGRYVLDPAVFDVLEATAPGRGGEIQLTDALRDAGRRCRASDGRRRARRRVPRPSLRHRRPAVLPARQ